MSEGLTSGLLFSAFVTLIAGLFIIRGLFSWRVSIAIVLVRVLIPVAYFAWFYDATWNFLDDLAYEERGYHLLHTGVSPWGVFFDDELIQDLRNASGGGHILYVWWNLLAQYLLGAGYHSAVFLNIIVTFFCAVYLGKLISGWGLSERYVKGVTAFFLLHWDIVAWSSLINLKDILVMAFTIMSFYHLQRIVEKFSVWRLVVVAFFFLCLVWTRYYVPMFILAAGGLSVFLQSKGSRKYFLIPIIVVGLYYVFPAIGDEFDLMSLDEAYYGIIRFLVTPQPWSIEESSSFLLIPSILHWIFFIPVIFTYFLAWKGIPRSRMLLVYFALMVFLYGVTTDLQGPRQRLQLVFIIAWLQYHFLYCWLGVKLRLLENDDGR